MWDTVDSEPGQGNEPCLSHDLPCQECGHAMHTYLACDDLRCSCRTTGMPGSAQVA